MIQYAETRRNLHTHTHTHTHGCLCKIILSIIAIAIITPTYAKDSNNHIEPAPTNDCIESTLGTATGPANLEADWTANTINLEWYNEDTKLTVPTISNTCTYDGGITLPSTNPTKTGYTFRGWQVRETIQQCSLSGLDTSENATYDAQHARWKPINSDSGYTMTWNGWTENSSDLNNGEWAVTFSYGTVKGTGLCSTTGGGTHATTGTPDESVTGKYCWCKATGLAGPNSTEYCPVASSSWVFSRDYNSADDCAVFCAFTCVGPIQNSWYFRKPLYGQ